MCTPTTLRVTCNARAVNVSSRRRWVSRAIYVRIAEEIMTDMNTRYPEVRRCRSRHGGHHHNFLFGADILLFKVVFDC